MKSIRMAAFFAALALFGFQSLANAAISEDPHTVLGGLCDASDTLGVCYYFLGPKHAEDGVLAGNQYACKLFRGVFKPVGARCPQASRVGRCRVKHEAPEALTILYYSPMHDLAKGKAECEKGKNGQHGIVPGKWVPEP